MIFIGKVLVLAAKKWKGIALTVGILAGARFVGKESFGQAMLTLQRFIWLIVACLILLVVARYLSLKIEREKRWRKDEDRI